MSLIRNSIDGHFGSRTTYAWLKIKKHLDNTKVDKRWSKNNIRTIMPTIQASLKSIVENFQNNNLDIMFNTEKIVRHI